MAFIAVAYVLGLNCTVRHFGGDAFPLSVVRLPEKTQAVLMLGAHSVKHLWNDHCDDPRPFVIEAAKERGIPVSFALSIAKAESNFRSHSISSTGAMGVMQLMPNTARENGVIDPFDPQQNARGASTFLESLWKRYRGNRMRIAAAYNAGPGRVARTGALKVPRETQGYAKRVVARDKNSSLFPVAMNDR
jgi:soluble lytic murein transglycosylase-like protein